MNFTPSVAILDLLRRTDSVTQMWDVSAARSTGYVTLPHYALEPSRLLYLNRFKGAYCTVWEQEPLLELFGDMDVVADTLPEMAEKVITAEG